MDDCFCQMPSSRTMLPRTLQGDVSTSKQHKQQEQQERQLEQQQHLPHLRAARLLAVAAVRADGPLRAKVSARAAKGAARGITRESEEQLCTLSFLSHFSLTHLPVMPHAAKAVSPFQLTSFLTMVVLRGCESAAAAARAAEEQEQQQEQQRKQHVLAVVGREEDGVAVEPDHLVALHGAALGPLQEHRAGALQAPVAAAGHAVRVEVGNAGVAQGDAADGDVLYRLRHRA